MHQDIDPVNAQMEYGAAPPEAQDQPGLPPGGGRFVLPHFMTFSQLVNTVSRTYRWTFDEALRHNRNNARACRRDPVVMDALRSRQLPTAQLPWHLECEDDKDTRQADAVTELTAIIEQIPNLQRLKMHLLEAIWWGRYGVQLVYRWDYSTGRRRLVIADHRPINGDKLVFKYSGESGVLVHASYPGEWEQSDQGRAHFFTPEEREHVLIHRHEPEDADFYEPELAGAVEGVGIRNRIYWFWWLRSQVSAFLMDYLERIGAGGFTIYYYEAGNPESLDEVKKSAEEQHRNNTILFPRYKDGSTGGPGVQRIEPSNAGAQLLQTLISGYFDEVIRRYILGQNLTTEARGTGLGSGVADLHADTFSRIVKYDAINLAETLTTDLVWVLQDKLFPGIPKLRFVFDVDKPNARDVLESAQAFYQMGGAVDEDELRSIIGLAKPQPGHSILAKMGNLAPAGMPTGVPMMGQPGPDLGMGGDPMGLGPAGLGGMGGPMMMARRGQPLRLASRFRPGDIYQEELRVLCDIAEKHHAPEVREAARSALDGDTHALVFLHDALLEVGDESGAEFVINLLAFAARQGTYDLGNEEMRASAAADEEWMAARGDRSVTEHDRDIVSAYMQNRPQNKTPEQLRDEAQAAQQAYLASGAADRIAQREEQTRRRYPREQLRRRRVTSPRLDYMAARTVKALDRSFPGRIRVYKNLHLSPTPEQRKAGDKRPDVYSVMDLSTRRVIGHLDSDITLKDVDFIISPSGRLRAEESGVRNVHAFLEGTIDHNADDSETFPTDAPLTYNPFDPHRRTFETGGNFHTPGTPVTRADRAGFRRGRIFIEGGEDSGERVDIHNRFFGRPGYTPLRNPRDAEQLKRRRRPHKYADTFDARSILFPDEQHLLLRMARHRDPNVRSLARHALQGHTPALYFLHDALGELGQDEDADLVAGLASYVSRRPEGFVAGSGQYNGPGDDPKAQRAEAAMRASLEAGEVGFEPDRAAMASYMQDRPQNKTVQQLAVERQQAQQEYAESGAAERIAQREEETRKRYPKESLSRGRRSDRRGRPRLAAREQYARDRKGRPYGWHNWARSLSEERLREMGIWWGEEGYYDPIQSYNSTPAETLEEFLNHGIPAEWHQAILDDADARQLVFSLLDGDDDAALALEDRLRELGYEDPRNMLAMRDQAKHQTQARIWNQTPPSQWQFDHPETYYPTATEYVTDAINRVKKKPKPPQQSQ